MRKHLKGPKITTTKISDMKRDLTYYEKQCKWSDNCFTWPFSISKKVKSAYEPSVLHQTEKRRYFLEQNLDLLRLSLISSISFSILIFGPRSHSNDFLARSSLPWASNQRAVSGMKIMSITMRAGGPTPAVADPRQSSSWPITYDIRMPVTIPIWLKAPNAPRKRLGAVSEM